LPSDVDGDGESGLTLVDLSVVEQRYRAVLAGERGEPKIVVAAQFGVSRQTLHTWLTRYVQDGLAELMDRTHRPEACPHQARAEVETQVCELRRKHLDPCRVIFLFSVVILLVRCIDLALLTLIRR
jgi:transposase